MRSLLSVVLCVGVAAMATAEQIDNPQYAQWAKFKVGAFVTLKSTTDMGEFKTETEMTTKLISLTAEMAVTELTGSTIAMGNKVEMPPQKTEIPARMEKPEMPEGVTPEAEAPKPKTSEGEEEVTVGDQTLKCKWYETVVEEGANKTVSKTWMCEAVPGSVVKSETTVEGEAKATMKTWIVSFKTE